MIAALIFVLAMSQLFMGMYLVGNEFGLGAEKTILQSCFFGMFFILLFQAALFQRNAKGENDFLIYAIYAIYAYFKIFWKLELFILEILKF